MAKKRLTTRQQEWETEYKKLKRRVKDWKRKYHVVPELPNKPERIYQKDIERLKQFIWKNISEPEKKRWRQEYEYRYENKMPDVYAPRPPYKPPTETDFVNNIPDVPQPLPTTEESDEEPDEDGYTPTIDSREELEKWLESVVNDVVISLPEKEILHGVADNIYNYVNQAFWQAEHFQADIQYLQYLEENADRFHDLALKAIHGYESKGNVVYLEQGGETALAQFVTLLNFGRPISPEDSANYNEASMFGASFEDMYG